MNFKKRLQQKQQLLGTMLTLPSAEVAEIVSHCGYDWLFVDGEHGPLSARDCQALLQAVGDRSASLVRVIENTEAEIKKMLDVGADGIIAPRVNSADEAADIVSWCKYPPQGIRGVGLARAHGYGTGFSEYMERANDDIVVVVQAEHIDAVENIESIVQVEGVDAVFVGPYDLSASIGKMGQIDDAEVVEAIDRVTRVCQQNGMPLGYFGTSAESVKPYADQGYNLICAGTDAGFISQNAMQLLEKLK